MQDRANREVERSTTRRARPARDVYANEESKLRYEAYSRLQAAAVAFGEKLPIPEIVAIGGQSDGKSSLIEAFLGFRFNVREVEMGTRRPLVVQMVHDASADEPRCRLQNEDDEEYGPVITPPTAVAEMLKTRTEQHLAAHGDSSVSSKAMCMRVEYAFCPNLTVIDTPGLILKAKSGQTDDSPEAILSMVKSFIAPPHRLILFLQQSSVEWASSLWLHVVQEVDPTFARTVMVCSKFDNRMREFKESWEVNKFLSASGYLPSKVKPFFVSLPSDRSICTADTWRRQIHEVDNSTLEFLKTQIKGGFDETSFSARMGFGNLRRFLENELARRYRESAPSTLSILQQRCNEVNAELQVATKRLNSLTDASALRRAAMEYTGEVVSEISALLRGTSMLDPSVFGMTTEEEHAYLAVGAWPGVGAGVRPPNASLKLYGGAAFERCLHEFQKAADQLNVPAVARDRVANVLLAHRSIGAAAMGDQVAQQIAAGMASALLLPLLDAASGRLSAMLRRVFDIAKLAMDGRSGGASEMLRMYVSFHASLQSAYSSFVSKLEESARAHLRRQLEANTSQFTLQVLMSHIYDLPAADERGLSSTLHDQLDLEPTDGPRTPRENSEGSDGIPAHREGDALDPQLEEEQSITANHSNENATAAAAAGHPRKGGIQAYIDGSPSKGRVRKAPRALVPAGRGGGAPASPLSPNPLFERSGRDDVYETVVDKASRLFTVIRHTVVCELAPCALKSAFLDPLHATLFTEVFLHLFACSDKHFMTMFHAESAVQSLTQKTEYLARRAEGLNKCKNEFAELSRCL